MIGKIGYKLGGGLLLIGGVWFAWAQFIDAGTPYLPQFITVERELVPPPQWAVAANDEIRQGVERAKAVALKAARAELDSWHAGVMEKVDAEYLDWHFSYFSNLVAGITDASKSIIFSTETVERDRQKATAEQFSSMVMPPLIVESTFRHVAELAVTRFQEELPNQLSAVRAKYSIAPAQWDAHLENIVVLTRDMENQTSQSFTLKSVAIGGGLTTASMGLTLVELSLPMIETALATAGYSMAGGSAVTTASVFGEPVIMALAAAAIIGWEYLDHRETVARNKPLLRAHIEDYLRGFERDQLKPDGVIGAPLHRITNSIARSLAS